VFGGAVSDAGIIKVISRFSALSVQVSTVYCIVVKTPMYLVEGRRVLGQLRTALIAACTLFANRIDIPIEGW
jgi:hypothetical protein